MIHRFVFAGLLFVAAAGCRSAGEPRPDGSSLADSSASRLQALMHENEDVRRRVDALTRQVEFLAGAMEKVGADLAATAARPDTIRQEIVDEVKTIRRAIATEQREFRDDMERRLRERDETLDARLDARLAVFEDALRKNISFVEFVATEQDSVNRVFAERIDNRPWYRSIIGAWKDHERLAKGGP